MFLLCALVNAVGAFASLHSASFDQKIGYVVANVKWVDKSVLVVLGVPVLLKIVNDFHHDCHNIGNAIFVALQETLLARVSDLFVYVLRQPFII